MIQKLQPAEIRFSFPCFAGTSDVYIVVMLFAVGVASYFLTGGLVPRIERNPKNPVIVQSPNSSTSAKLDVLQLVNMESSPATSAISPDATSGALLSPEQ